MTRKQVVISTGGRDLLAVLSAKISLPLCERDRNDILAMLLLRRDTSGLL
jgi:hypothetical protein